MAFKPIPLKNYAELYLSMHPSESKKEVIVKLENALADYNQSIKCSCGNDIWVIGSAFSGNACFTCITGESIPVDDYEIDSAINKSENKKGRRHIDDIPPDKIAGFFDDDGYEIDMNSIKKPSLCITCINDNNPAEDLLCNMTRYDQRNKKNFVCYGYRKMK